MSVGAMTPDELYRAAAGVSSSYVAVGPESARQAAYALESALVMAREAGGVAAGPETTGTPAGAPTTTEIRDWLWERGSEMGHQRLDRACWLLLRFLERERVGLDEVDLWRVTTTVEAWRGASYPVPRGGKTVPLELRQRSEPIAWLRDAHSLVVYVKG
jgi:hypothetical protein